MLSLPIMWKRTRTVAVLHVVYTLWSLKCVWFVYLVKQRLRELFAEIDTDNSGTLDREEVKALAEKLGVEMTTQCALAHLLLPGLPASHPTSN